MLNLACSPLHQMGRSRILASLKYWFIRSSIPLLRAYIRYVPFVWGKRSFWTKVVAPHFAWHSFNFVAPTVFGSLIAGDTSDIIQNYIYYFGVWEPNLTDWIGQRLAPGDTFIDVGANIGYFSLLASKLIGNSGTVVAIEASPKIFSALQSNLARNQTQNVRAVNVAASDRKGMLRLFHGPDDNIGLTTALETSNFEFECEINSSPLSDILQPEEIRNARIIKIDVEGAEWSVVAGIGQILSLGRRDLEVIIEVSPERLAQQGKRTEDILKIFLNAGFHMYSLENDYSSLSYLPPYCVKRPIRIRNPVQRQTDVVLSRQDSEQL